jgi:hypothetical protein
MRKGGRQAGREGGREEGREEGRYGGRVGKRGEGRRGREGKRTLGSFAQLRGSKPKSPGWRSPPWSICTMATKPKSSKKPVHTRSCCMAPDLTAAS